MATAQVKVSAAVEQARQRDYEEFLGTVFADLEAILEERPKNPVTAFAQR